MSKLETLVLPRLEEIRMWARDGVIDKEIAKRLKVAYSTFRTYVKENEELAEAVRKGKEIVDAEVESALLKRALGYAYTETTRERGIDAEGNLSLVVTKEVTKEIAPDVGAAEFWLKNRRRGKWQDKQEVEHTGDVEVKMTEQLKEWSK